MDRSTEHSPSDLLDRIAIAMSGLCLLHCIAFPILLVMIPVIGEFGSGHFHLQILVFVLPVSLVALGSGFLRHRNAAVLLAGALGLGLLLLGATWAHSTLGLMADRLATIAGSVVLALAHYANSRLGRQHRAACRS